MGEPCPKKHKLGACFICDKCSDFTDKKDVYTQMLITHLFPPQLWDDAKKSQTFDFCAECVSIVEDILQLKEGLEFILKSISKKVLEIKCLILTSIQQPSSDASIQSFRQTAVKDLRPRVDMEKNNFFSSSNNGLGNDEFLGDEINSPMDEAINSPDNSEGTKSPEISNSFDPYLIPKIENFGEISNVISLPAVEKNVDNDNPKIKQPIPSTTPPLLTIVPPPKPFPKAVTSIVGTGNRAAVKNTPDVEGSVVVITEPPKFNKDQKEIYYENYRDMYKCKFCSLIVKAENNIANLSRHINVIHAQNSRFKCAVCLAIFFSRKKCSNHIREIHITDRIVSQEKELLMNIKANFSDTSNSTKFNKITLIESVADPLILSKIPVSDSLSLKDSEMSYSKEDIAVAAKKDHKYSNDKIRSEVMINIESKSSYNFIEEAIKFEPWEESSTDNNIDMNPFMEEDAEDSNSNPATTKEIESEVESTDSADKTVVESQKEWLRPSLSVLHLIILAITNMDDQSGVTSKQICNRICELFPYYLSKYDKFLVNLRRTISGKSILKDIGSQAFSGPSHLYQLDPTKVSISRIATAQFIKEQSNVDTMAFPEQVEELVKNVLTKGVCNDLEQNDEERSKEMRSELVRTRAPFTYCQLSLMALCSSDTLRSIHDITVFIRLHFPYFRTTSKWTSLLFRSLSKSECFKLTSGKPEDMSKHKFKHQLKWKVENNRATAAMKEEIQSILMTAPIVVYESVESLENLEKIVLDVFHGDFDFDSFRETIDRYEGKPSSEDTIEILGVFSGGVPPSSDSPVSIIPEPGILENLLQGDMCPTKWRRPPLSFAQMAYLALESCAPEPATLAKIKQFITNHFPFYQSWTPLSLASRLFHGIKYHNAFIRDLGNTSEYSDWQIAESRAGELKESLVRQFNFTPVELYQSANDPGFLQKLVKRTLKYDFDVATVKYSVKEHQNQVVIEIERGNEEILETDSVAPDGEMIAVSSKNAITGSAGELIPTSSDDPIVISDDENDVQIIEEDERSKRWSRPPMTYAELGFLALFNCRGRRMSSVDIVHKFLLKNFPYFGSIHETNVKLGLDSALEHACWFKMLPSDNEHGLDSSPSMWAVNEENSDTVRLRLMKMFMCKVTMAAFYNCCNEPEYMKKIVAQTIANLSKKFVYAPVESKESVETPDDAETQPTPVLLKLPLPLTFLVPEDTTNLPQQNFMENNFEDSTKTEDEDMTTEDEIKIEYLDSTETCTSFRISSEGSSFS